MCLYTFVFVIVFVIFLWFCFSGLSKENKKTCQMVAIYQIFQVIRPCVYNLTTTARDLPKL